MDMNPRTSIRRYIPLALTICGLLGWSMSLQAQRFRPRKSIACTFTVPDPTKLPWESPGDFHRLVLRHFNNAQLDIPRTSVQPHTDGATLSLEIGTHLGNFHGHFDLPAADSLPPVQDWQQIDSFAALVARDIILEVTTYDPVRFPEVDSVTCLGGPLTIGLELVCKFDHLMMDFASHSAPYLGEFSFLHPQSDTLRLELVLEGKDTTVAIGIGQELNLLDHAALNGLAIQLQVKAAMATYCGTAPDYLMQLPPNQRGIFPLIWLPIRMNLDNLYQKEDIITKLSLRFGSKFKVRDQMTPPKANRAIHNRRG